MLECIEAVADHGSILDAQPHVVAKLARAVLLYLSPLVRRIDFAVDWVGSLLDFATTYSFLEAHRIRSGSVSPG